MHLASETSGTPTFTYLGPMLMVVGVVLLGVLVTMSIRGKVARRQANTPSAREQIDQIRRRADTGVSSVQKSQSDLLDMARQLSAKLDLKAERLDQLICEAQVQIERLERAGVQAEASTDIDDAPIEAMDPLTAEVYRLADAGRSPVEIAGELDEQTGKIELILALRSKS